LAITKGVTQTTDWTAVAQNTVGESGTLDCSGHYSTDLFIQAFLDTTTAHTGTEFIVQVSSNTTGNEDWHDYTKFSALIGTAATDLIEDAPLAALSTAIALTGHALTVKSKWLAIEDGTLINSELVYQVNSSTNEINILDGTTNAHAATTAIFNVAISEVVTLDPTVNRVRVVVNNAYDVNGSTLNFKLRSTQVTSV